MLSTISHSKASSYTRGTIAQKFDDLNFENALNRKLDFVYDFDIDFEQEETKAEEDKDVSEFTIDLEPLPMASSTPRLFAKRKSESWSSKPLEKKKPKESPIDSYLYNSFADELLQLDLVESGHLDFENTCSPHLPTIEDEFTMLAQGISSMECDENMLEVPPPIPIDDQELSSRQLMKARKSEDWSLKPKLKRASSLPMEADLDPNKRRAKWTQEELFMLWQGILNEGNNWKAISKELQSRSYFQIKDKGRRLLFLRGWTTGRNKNDTDDGNRKAKEIARRVLNDMRMRKK